MWRNVECIHGVPLERNPRMSAQKSVRFRDRSLLSPDFPIRLLSYTLRRAGEFALRQGRRLECIRIPDRETRRLLASNKEFEGCFRGRRAFVVGNGPSLGHHDLTLLADEIVMVSNGFACHPILSQWQPFSLTLVDPLYFERWEEFRVEFERIRSNLRCLIFIPASAREVVIRHRLLPLERCRFVGHAGSMAYHDSWHPDLTQVIPGAQNVVLQLIASALYMGCDPIYLVGLDHDFLASPKKATHFSADYESDVKLDLYPSWEYIKLIRACELMWLGYENISKVAGCRGQRIINASQGGYLDVFPRADYRLLFETSKPDVTAKLVSGGSAQSAGM